MWSPETAIPAAGFWAVRGIPVAMAAVSQRGEVTRAETGYDTGSMRGDLGQPLPLQALSAVPPLVILCVSV